MKQYTFAFEESRATKESTYILGNKGAQLSEMTSIGLPVPPGFTITTDACKEFYEINHKWPSGLEEQTWQKLSDLEKKTGKKFGSNENPLLVSVRSGSYVSMPGMMDTVLNLGLNDETVKGLISQTKNERLAYDCYRRFIHMFADIVMKVPHELFRDKLDEMKNSKGISSDTDLSANDFKELVNEYKKIVSSYTNQEFPTDPKKQLILSINAVFNSWNSERAIKYRQLHNLSNSAGTAVNVQSMVFGNYGDDSATGVGFTRNPATGQNELYGEYLINAQGEDVVAGLRTPEHITDLKNEIPQAFNELKKIVDILEKHYKDMQDFEFTIEKGKLFMLQTRSGKRTAQAAVKIAVDMEKEGLITKEQALLLVKPEQLDQLLHKQLDPEAKKVASIIAKGLAASPGAAVGVVVFSPKKAVLVTRKEKLPVILVRTETSPEDIEGMAVAQGILTERGGLTSHAAVVARGMGKCCVAGSQDILVEEKNKEFRVKKDKSKIKEGEWISLDGATGEVFLGKLGVVDPIISKDFLQLMQWADETRILKVRANADTPADAEKARQLGAEGIGLTRTEHMFFEKDRIKAVREMIIATNTEGRKKALAKLLPMQKQDFIGIFKAMNGLPVTIRLLDPPLHEFLPKSKRQLEELAEEMDMPVISLKRIVKSLTETNPMLGHRGCRLGLTYPEIYEMQVRAILEAAIEVQQQGFSVLPEIEIPLISNKDELKVMKKLVETTAEEIGAKGKIHYKIGTMIELPRACVVADELAEYAEFFSFGTNDLTQTTLGFSRDDVGKFVPEFLAKGILDKDPFAVIDEKGVGSLMQLCVQKARLVKPNLEIGICGEHGGEPQSVEFCHKIGLNYVSCSPYRVPIARLAAAQAAIKYGIKANAEAALQGKFAAAVSFE